MEPHAGETGDASRAEVPHPIGVRDLKRERRELAAAHFAAGTTGADRRGAMADLVRRRLTEHWDEVTQGRDQGATLAAVGSIGRRDAGPESDLDLVLIHDGHTSSPDEIADLAARLWYPIWDAGLELDHSLRSIAECRQVASVDLAAAAGLLDLRVVAGDGGLVRHARALIYQDWRSAARSRLPDLLGASRGRADRYGELAYLIEPNLKESRGGLRDLTSLTALAATWLTDRPHNTVDAAGHTLLDVRDAIQVVTGHNQSVFARHIAADVADLLGVSDPDEVLASLADAGRTIAYALDTTERGARRSLDHSDGSARGWKARRRGGPPRFTAVATGLIEVEGELALAPDYDTTADPVLPLRAAAAAATTGLAFTPTLLECMAACPDLPAPWPDEAREQLHRLLRSSTHLVSVWEAIDLAGLAVRWLPEWEGVRNRPQRSAIHRYTVDRHSIEAVVLAGDALDTVADPTLLLFAAWLHDIGKRPGATDHSIDGAALIAPICARMGLTDQFAHDTELLVREHLTLARLATTRDPEDEQTVADLLAAVEGREDLLDALRALTQADAVAAGPKAWTAWRESLINTLTASAKRTFAQLDNLDQGRPQPQVG